MESLFLPLILRF